ncbi:MULTISPECIES: HGGxSTG domain-containing protein [Bradyrhizobium]|uniref:HGGxSTG domain-containing protein n=2 Tax=Nitrobacteraceae TaxID=41294 RepID=UPI003221B6D3
MSHARNTAPMRTSPRCGAQTRDGDTCRAPALRGRPRCRMHGGAAGSGAPFGNSNAVKHGFFTSEAIEERELVRTVLREAERLLRQLPSGFKAIRNFGDTEPEHLIGNGSAAAHLTYDKSVRCNHGPIKADPPDRDRRRGR